MSDACIKKLETEWESAEKQKDFVKCAKILRAQINLLKLGNEAKCNARSFNDSIAPRIAFLELALADMDCESALTVIGHLRYARKTLSLSSGDFGSAFKREISAKERARIRKRNRPPVLGIQNREKLEPGYAIGPPADVLQPSVLGNGDTRMA